MTSTPQSDGNGRLWERFELANINERIENIYQYFKSVDSQHSRRSGDLADIAQQQEHLDKMRKGISSQLNKLIKDLEIKYNEKTKPWKDENIKLKSQLNDVKNRLRDVNRDKTDANKEKQRLENKYNTLRTGLDQIINDSNSKNQERIQKLSHQNRQLANEKEAAVKQAKKEKKLRDEFLGELQEKYDKLASRHRKTSGDKAELITDRDNLARKCQSLEAIIRENREVDNNRLLEENGNLKNDLKVLQKKNNQLLAENNKLDDEYRVLANKYDLEKEAFKKAIENQIKKKQAAEISKKGNNNTAQRDEIRKLRQELNDKHSRELKKRESAWTKAKNDSIKTLDAQYDQMADDKERQIECLTASNDELKKNLEGRKDEIRRLRAENNKINDLKDQIQALNDELNDKCKEIVDLRTELSKYKILWQHFFGLDAPLKDEIEILNDKLDKFENYHKIKSPIPKKKGRVRIEALSQWNMDSPPLILDAIPSPKDKYQRIELYNTHNKVIELIGFRIESGKGDVIKLDQRQVNPGACIPIALKQKRSNDDILYDVNFGNNNNQIFCNFNQDECIFLCDSFEGKIQIFPLENKDNGYDGVIYENLTAFSGELRAPIFVKQLFNEDGYQGFVFGNQTQKKIKLKGMYFRNKRKTLEVKIPQKILPINGVIKLIITDNPNDGRIGRNDLTVDPNDIKYGVDDSLLLCDEYDNSIELYNLDGTGIDHDTQRNNSKSKSECFIM